MASVKYAREFAQLRWEEDIMLLSQDEKDLGYQSERKRIFC